MAEKHGNQVFSDAAWEALIEEVRPHGKTPPQDLRRTISAIFWRHPNGAKWRSIPSERGPWWRAAQLFIRWAKQGVWERLLGLAQQQDLALGMSFLDGTSIRAHPKAAGAQKKGVDSAQRDVCEALGRSRSGRGTKACVIADGRGRAIAFTLAPGQAHELPLAPGLLARLPRGLCVRCLSPAHRGEGGAPGHSPQAHRGAGRLPGLDLLQPPSRRESGGAPQEGARRGHPL
jgi:transposase